MMTTSKFLFVFSLAFALGLVACSGSGSGPIDKPANALAAVDCAGTVCDSDKQYCLKTGDSDGNIKSAKCVDKPAGCSECDCLTDSARKQVPGVTDVGAWTDCPVPKDGKFTVVCHLP